jgi:hypothetical protein
MEVPSNHHGIPRPPRKKSAELFPADLEATTPIPITITKNPMMIAQSIV